MPQRYMSGKVATYTGFELSSLSLLMIRFRHSSEAKFVLVVSLSMKQSHQRFASPNETLYWTRRGDLESQEK